MNKRHDFAQKVVTDPLEAVRRIVYDARKLDAAALAVGVSHTTLSRQLADEDTHLPVRRAFAIADFLDSDVLAECSAARRGGVFVKLPASESKAFTELLEGFASLTHEFSHAAHEFAAMVSDGRIEPDEVDRFEKALHEVYAHGEQLKLVARARQVK
jgi:hypothetical protein